MTKLISFALFFLLMAFVCEAKKDSTFVATSDTLRVQERVIDASAVEKFKADSAFQYGRPQEAVSPWQRFLTWVFGILGTFLLYTTQTLLGKIILYTALVCLMLWVILKLLNIDVKDLFYRKNAAAIDFKLAEENIHALDFDALIDSAVQKKEYRLAVRLTFLDALKKLSEAHIIQWVPGKTNDDYLKEASRHASLMLLQELRYYFDYAWYGHFEINENTYEAVRQSFQELKSTLG
jgi:hypothetical protein